MLHKCVDTFYNKCKEEAHFTLKEIEKCASGIHKINSYIKPKWMIKVCDIFKLLFPSRMLHIIFYIFRRM